MICNEPPLLPTRTVPAFPITKVRLVPSGIDWAELVRGAEGAVAVRVVTVGLGTTGLVGDVAVGVVEVVDVELVEEVLPLVEQLDPSAQAKAVARSTAVTAAAAKGIRYFILTLLWSRGSVFVLGCQERVSPLSRKYSSSRGHAICAE
jgi:hypothetical protein